MINRGSCLPIVLPAILAHLTAAPSGLVVYDAGDVPQAAPLPYVVLQSPTETREGEVMGRASKRFTVEAHVWTSTDDVSGSGQATAIVSTIVERMHYPALSLGPQWALKFCRADQTFDGGDDVDPGGPVKKHLVVVIEGEAKPV